MRFICQQSIAVILIWVTGCASYPINPPIDQIDPSVGYRFSNLAIGDKNTDKLFVLVSLSGGGTRAMALDFGVLSYLDTLRIGGGERSLLDEVDVISTSSASGLVAAFYGLHGKQAFLDRFRDDILDRNIERDLKFRVLNPFGWPRLMSPTFGRSDIAAEYFDKEFFENQTFAAMRKVRPLVLVNATDMGIGAPFSFAQGRFDSLCSNLSRVSVGRAVAASMAYMPAFSPITLKNYDKNVCGYITPDWVRNTLTAGIESNAFGYAQARNLLSYESTERRPYIHLLDSGIADNIGIRIPGLAFSVQDAPWSQAERLLDGTIEKLVIILVDAKPKRDFEGDLKPRPPGAISTITAAAGRPLANYSYQTVDLVRQGMKSRREQKENFDDKRAACAAHALEYCTQKPGFESCETEVKDNCFQSFGVTEADRPPPLGLYLLHVSFESIQDATKRQRLERIPTALHLPSEDIDLLIDSAPALINSAPDFQRLRDDMALQEADDSEP